MKPRPPVIRTLFPLYSFCIVCNARRIISWSSLSIKQDFRVHLPRMTGCPICGCPRQARFRALLLKRHDVQYFFCERCGLLQTEEPYWLSDAYASVIADADTGLVSRNLTIAH